MGIRTLLAISLLLNGGCTLLTATAPQVDVQGVKLLGAGPLDQVLGVTLCVMNPNDTELAFRRVTVTADVSGVPFTDSRSDGDVRLPPHASVLVPFTVVTTVRNLGPQLLGVLRTGSVGYRVRGTVQLAGALPITVPFSRSGRLDVLDIGSGLLADAATPGTSQCVAGEGGRDPLTPLPPGLGPNPQRL